MFNATLNDTWEQLRGIAPSNIEPFLDATLASWGIAGPGLSLDEKKRRYVRFEGLDFGVAPPDQWPALRRDLLELEQHLACDQDAIGCVPEFPFRVQLKESVSFQEPAFPFPPKKRAWVREQLLALEASGVIERCPTVQCACQLVLVEGQQSGQDYRLCVNFIPLNAYTQEHRYPIPDQTTLRDQLADSTIFSTMDIKAGFNNIPIHEDSLPYTGINTQEGLFRYRRMTFGFLGAPYHFQYIMDRTLALDPSLLALVFFDDVTTHGESWQYVWQQTLRALRVLASVGFMINLRKCRFLVARAVVLGMDISRASCALGDKYLQRWLSVRLPRTLAELQSIIGKLVWASGFLPNFKEEVRPIEALLSRTTTSWTADCTDTLNRLVALIFRRMRLGLIDYSLPVNLFVGYTQHSMRAILTQVQTGMPRPIAIIGRRLRAREPSPEPLVAELEAIVWAMRALARYTLFVPRTRVHVVDPAHIQVLREHQVTRVRAFMIELGMYPVEWVVGEQEWPAFDIDANCPQTVELAAPQWKHEEGLRVLRRADISARAVDVHGQDTMVAMFDGGAGLRQGTGGYVVYGTTGVAMRLAALWYGADRPTVNEAETAALHDLMVYLGSLDCWEGVQQVVVYGDSRLAIDFANRQARPGKSSLFILVRKITQLRRSLPVPVLYRHTDRANNAVADWLTNVSRELGCSCTVNPGSFHLGDPVPWSADQASAHVREIHLLGQVTQSRMLCLTQGCMPLVTSYLRECGVSTSQQQAVIEEARVALLAGSPLGFCLCKRCFQPLSSEGKVVSRVHCPRCNVRTLAATESVVSPLAPLRPYLTTHGELGVAPCTLMPVFQGDGSVPTRKCSVCASGVGSAGGMRCWRCSKYYHYRCLGMARVSRGPWVCPSCRERSIALGEKDIVLDEHLMQTVVTREAPAVWPLLEVERCVRAARWLKWSRGALWVCDDVYGERRIPPLWEREALVRYTAMQLGFPHGSRVYCLLRQRYYWANLRRDCIRICATAIAVQIEGARFKPPSYIFPSAKDARPFWLWCVDIMVKLKPTGESGESYLVVAVCAYSKWVEAGPILRKDSGTLMRWFHSQIVCRFGVPYAVRCDRGTEFSGQFADYLQSLGIRQQLVSSAHPRANGIVERYNGCIKAGLRRMAATFGEDVWHHYLPDILAGLRFLPSKIGYSPYLVAFKQEVCWIGDIVGPAGLDIDDSVGPDEQLLSAQVRWWDAMEAHIRIRLRQADERMARAYRSARGHMGYDLRFTFRAGDQVLLRQRRPGKAKPHAEGPFTFLRYTRSLGVTAIIQAPSGAEMEVSIANLLPLRTGSWGPVEMFESDASSDDSDG